MFVFIVYFFAAFLYKRRVRECVNGKSTLTDKKPTIDVEDLPQEKESRQDNLLEMIAVFVGLFLYKLKFTDDAATIYSTRPRPDTMLQTPQTQTRSCSSSSFWGDSVISPI